jgi:hypothetical protein
MFLVAVVALSLITVPLAGGRLSKLSDMRLRWTPVIFAALVIQVVIVSVAPGGDAWFHRFLHLASYGLAGTFLWVNRRQPGIWVVAVGATLNAIAIVANNGVMPASTSALRVAGEVSRTNGFVNSTGLAHPRLLALGDIFAIPKSWPLHNVFSLGDVCIAIGAAIAIHVRSGSRLAGRRPRRPATEIPDDQPVTIETPARSKS